MIAIARTMTVRVVAARISPPKATMTAPTRSQAEASLSASERVSVSPTAITPARSR